MDETATAQPFSERRTRSIEVGVIIAVATFGLALIGQTAAVAWAASAVSAKLDYVAQQVAELKSERYSQADARRDNQLQDQKLQDLIRRVQRNEDLLNGLMGTRTK
jgi:hypothetical protein